MNKHRIISWACTIGSSAITLQDVENILNIVLTIICVLASVLPTIIDAIKKIREKLDKEDKK